MLPKVAIVGRPNVGKSSLFNLLAGRRISIVDPVAGVTRDRVSASIELPRNEDVSATEAEMIELVDTGGFGADGDMMTTEVERQIALALREADLVILLVDAQAGVVALDRRVAELLRTDCTDVPVMVVANKVDTADKEAQAWEVSSLGLGTPTVVSAKTGYQKHELLVSIAEHLGNRRRDRVAPTDAEFSLAIVGKRNAGKSTLVNALAGAPRMIVSEEAGTTRDAVDVRFQIGDRAFTAIDTAGVRRQKSLDGDLEYYSYHRSLQSIRRADVVVLLIDATVPVSQVDSKLSGEILRHEKPCIVAVNKWDLVEGQQTQEAYVDYLDDTLRGLDFAPLAFISAIQGDGMADLAAMACNLFEQASHRVSTGVLNRHLAAIMERRRPHSKHGRRAKIYYSAQVAVRPPTIGLWVNDPDLFDATYRRYVLNQLREVLPFSEVPIRLDIHERRERRERRGG